MVRVEFKITGTMKKNTITVLFLFLASLSFSQISLTNAIHTSNQITKDLTPKENLEKKWIHTAEVEFTLTSKVDYSFSTLDSDGHTGRDVELANKPSYDVLYTINYPIIKKLSLGGLIGYQHQTQQSISAMKLGGLFRYFFRDYESINMYLSLAKNIALSNNIETAMANVRIGSAFPIDTNDRFNITLNVFWDYNYYNVRKPILSLNNEIPGTITTRGYGVSLGIQF